MTAICVSSGPSGPKAGLPANLVNVAGAADLFSAIPELAFLAPVSVLLNAVAYNLPTFCATDPPGFQTFTGAEVVAFAANLVGPDYFSFLAKAQDTLATLTWYQSCQCISGAQPTQPTPPAAPADAPTITGPASVAPSGPCYSQTGIPPQDLVSLGPPVVLTPKVSALSAFVDDYYLGARTVGGLSVVIGYRFPSNATQYTITYHRTSSGGTAGATYQFNHGKTGLSSGREQSLASDSVSIAHGGADVVMQYQIIAGQLGIAVFGAISSGTTTDIPSISIQIYCGGIAQPQSPCCPPDQSSLLLLNAINTAVQLVQRQLAPFSYVASTAHTGISGNGTLSVQGLIGLKVDITTLPSRAGAEFGDPIVYWDLGWINLGTADGFGPRQFISSDPTLLFPISGAITVVGYSIPADVTVTITELVREA